MTGPLPRRGKASQAAPLLQPLPPPRSSPSPPQWEGPFRPRHGPLPARIPQASAGRGPRLAVSSPRTTLLVRFAVSPVSLSLCRLRPPRCASADTGGLLGRAVRSPTPNPRPRPRPCRPLPAVPAEAAFFLSDSVKMLPFLQNLPYAPNSDPSFWSAFLVLASGPRGCFVCVSVLTRGMYTSGVAASPACRGPGLQLSFEYRPPAPPQPEPRTCWVEGDRSRGSFVASLALEVQPLRSLCP